ncbi:hypothetical protein FN846DRAFT_910135 [Sphaerosporella brunnea]|uniref:HNH nuclease domain-containing protein n=1 Tax=Sphaerosporella brunnea TaxID=1250544 RepID=A0A5J5EP14_9PEZI|nr:hypothetical protein FN846DRAFT_910135 [Sphaerosporella brunnea]
MDTLDAPSTPPGRPTIPEPATPEAPVIDDPNAGRFSHFWSERNVIIRSLPHPQTGEVQQCGFRQHVDVAFQITFTVLFEMLRIAYVLDGWAQDRDEHLPLVLARVAGDGTSTLFSPQCSEAVQEGEYWLFQHCELEEMCDEHPLPWQSGTVKHHRLSLEQGPPRCCFRGNGLKPTAIVPEDPNRKVDPATVLEGKDKAPQRGKSKSRNKRAASEAADNASAKRQKLAAGGRSLTEMVPEDLILAADLAVTEDNIAKISDKVDLILSILQRLQENSREFSDAQLAAMNPKPIVTVTSRNKKFREAVEKRDLCCIVTKLNNHPPYVARHHGMLCGPAIQAAHIVPIGRPDIWCAGDFDTAIRQQRSLLQSPDAHGAIDLNATENGIMLREDLHTMFDRFFWGVHPRSMRVVVFVAVPELTWMHGMVIEPRKRTTVGWPPKAVWEWHWQQCVIRSLRGQGELPEFKYYGSPTPDAVPVTDQTEGTIAPLPHNERAEIRGRSLVRRCSLSKPAGCESGADAVQHRARRRIRSVSTPPPLTKPRKPENIVTTCSKLKRTKSDIIRFLPVGRVRPVVRHVHSVDHLPALEYSDWREIKVKKKKSEN